MSDIFKTEKELVFCFECCVQELFHTHIVEGSYLQFYKTRTVWGVQGHYIETYHRQWLF